MFTTKVLKEAATAAVPSRTPLIRFLGKRTTPKSIDHTPHAHPASPSHSLPDSFASYRSNVQQHGPLNRQMSSSTVGGVIGGQSGGSMGPVEAPQGQYFDRSELPSRFGRTPLTQAEIDAVETGGASMWA
ncbi:MAG: hypothetical protein M1829_002876 [Trizodia sp. TS-e1964]|nr:MAG: hypothetical protein M1829_002876 [Trizodia sp. TS-e1964]